MSTYKSQKKQNRFDVLITFAGFLLIVFILVGFYDHTHPEIETDAYKAKEKIENILEEPKQPL